VWWWWLSKHDGPFLNEFKIYFLSFRHNTNYKHTLKMAKSEWIKHVAAFRAAHKGMDPKKVFGEAAKTFKKNKQSGGLPQLSPNPVHGMRSSRVDLDTQVATQHGGKKSRKSKKSKSKSKKSKSKRSKSHKRRH
jgi:hypothetical protein